MTSSSSSSPLRAKPARGMRDMLPDEVALRDWATAQIVDTYESFGFTRIETPAVENIDLLKKGEGGENLNLIFEIMKRGEKLEKALAAGSNDGSPKEPLSDLGLRFDLTVPLTRFYANNNNDLPNPFKAIQIGNVWRAESPQQGRYRQFTQCDIDIIGVKGPFAELDLLQATTQALLNLNFTGFTVRINDRRLLTDIAKHCQFDSSKTDSVFIALDKLDKIGFDGVKAELLKDGSSEQSIEELFKLFKPSSTVVNNAAETFTKFDTDVNLNKALLNTMRELSKEAVDDLERLIDAANDGSNDKYSVLFDPTLVRGMGYYTGPIFEISAPGYSYSVAGGGRYDKMIEKFIGREVPAAGFSIGFERIITILQERGFKTPAKREKVALIYDPGRDTLDGVLKASKKLRTENRAVSLTPRKKDMKKHLDQLLEQGYSAFCAYRGDPDNLEVKPLSNS